MDNYAKIFARSGGEATRDKYGKDHFKELNKKSQAAKKLKELQVTITADDIRGAVKKLGRPKPLSRNLEVPIDFCDKS